MNPLLPTSAPRRRSLKLLGAAGLSALAGGASPWSRPAQAQTPAPATRPAPRGQVIIGHSQEITVLNPHFLHIEVDDGLHFALFDPLFGIDTQGHFYPVLARAVPTVENGGVSADGLSWRIHLRDDVRWHDGRPFSAEDVKFTLELLVDPEFKNWRRAGHELVRDLTVVSPTEIRWRMAGPFAPYLSILASTFILPKHAFEGVADKNNAPFNSAPIGTGAFKFHSRVAGSHIELSANTDYFGDGPYLERVLYRYIPDLTVLYTQFKSGEIDVIGLQGITADFHDEAQSLPGKQVVVEPGPGIETFGLNLSRPYFQERAVRAALYHALDKTTIINTIYYGLPKAVESYLPTQSYYHNPDLPAHEYSLDKARALLDAAGWRPGPDGIRSKNGVRLAFGNSTTSGNHLREQVQQYVQQSFRAIGAEMTIRNLPPAVMWGEYWMNSQFDTCIVGLIYISGADPDAADRFRSGASPATGGTGRNTWVYANPEADELFAQGGRTFDLTERRKLYRQAQTILRHDLPMLPMFQQALIRGHKSGLAGFAININNRIETWNVKQWRWI